MDSEGAGAETVYGTHDDSTMVMSEKVQSLAGSIYQEFERMISRYDEDVVKSLMPLLVNVLECLDAAYQNNQELDVELELVREDNEQLATQYEREKSARKQAEQKLLETEDLAEAENKELSGRLESIESIVRMLELKHKNSLEHSSRLEERESELKKEYSKLHERYTELFKTHVDYMERTKLLMGSTHSQMSSNSDRMEMNRGRLHPMTRSSGPVSYGFASLENSTMLDTETMCSAGNSSSGSGPPSLQNEFDNIQTVEKTVETDTLHHTNQATSPASEQSPVAPIPPVMGRSTTKKEQRSANTLYQELSFQDNEESEENEVTGSWVHPGEYASSVNDNFFGMGKEVENLIMENNELLATKNALNIVKDDLIVKVDELTGEIEILRDDLNVSVTSRNKLKQKVSDLEEELRKTKEQVKQQNTTEQEEEGDVPMAYRKRFTRVEMARVLMERNQYKERYMELQEAVRWAEIIRASKTVKTLDKSNKGVWKFFSNLFSSSDRPQREPSGPHLQFNVANNHVSAGTSEGRLAITAGGGFGNGVGGGGGGNIIGFGVGDGTSERAIQRRREQYRQVRAHVQKDDGRLQAYGWSLPGSKNNQEQQTKSTRGVPVPVYCQPLAAADQHMKVWCASGVNLKGGYTKDGGCMVGASVFYAQSSPKITEITTPTDGNAKVSELESLDKQITMAMENAEPDLQLSSYVWICTSNHTASTVIVINANAAADVLDSFPVCQTHLLCIHSVIGALESDYEILENSEIIKSGESLEKPGEGPDEIGRVEYIRVAVDEKREANPSDDVVNADSAGAEQACEPSIDLNDNVPAATEAIDGNERTDESNANCVSFESACTAVVEDVAVAVPTSPIHLTRLPPEESPTHTVPGDLGNAPNESSFTKPTNPITGSTNLLDEPVMSSVGPTMWLGAQNGMLYVHSSVARWRTCLHQVHLPDAVLSIVHVESRVVVALANGKLAVFRRQTDGQWDLNSYHLVTLGSPQQSVRCLCVVADKIWAAHRNKIHIVDPTSLNIVHTVEAHPRKESQIRQMAATGLGVWVSVRLDSTLRLYHAHTYEHLEDVDIEPYVSKMLGTGKLGFSFVRITALLVSCNRLWIGTANGVVISVPLTDPSTILPNKSGMSSKVGNIPRCFMANAQLSFHGHRHAVKFFVSVPMTANKHPLYFHDKPDMLVLSGGEGYIDFRLGDDDMENSIVLEKNQTIENRGDESYLIVWHVVQG